MRILLLLIAIFSFSVNANVWESLKRIPATQYDVGRIYLDVAAVEMTEKYQGEHIDHTHYKFYKVDSISDGDKLGLKFSFKARAKHINQKDCEVFLSSYKPVLSSDKVVKDIWPNLSEPERKEIADSFVFETDLIDKKTGKVVTTCR